MRDIANNINDPELAIKKKTNELLKTLDNVLDDIKSSTKDNVIKACAKGNNLLGKINSNNGKVDLSHLLKTATNLSDHLKNMTKNTQHFAREVGRNSVSLSGAAQAALEMDRLLQSLEGDGKTSDTFITAPSSTSLLGYDHSEDIPRPIIENPKTFEEVVDKVARDILVQNDNLTEKSVESTNVAKELFNLSTAARNGDRHAMLLSSKAISTNIAVFCKTLNTLASRIPGTTFIQKKEQERLQNCIQALKNFSVQMKILTSVKAASIDTDKDVDESLFSLTTSLGNVFTEALRAMDVTKKSILRE